MFSYSCPSCAQKLLAPPERAGQRTICPKCLKPLTIPTPSRADDEDGDDSLLHAGPALDAPTPPPADLTPVLLAPEVADPPPAPPRLPTRAAVRPPAVANPTGLAGVDLAVELTAALATRMRPPPEPAPDLRPATLGWAALALLAAGLWVAGVVADPAALPFVAVIGGLLAAAGGLWLVLADGRRSRPAGCLLTGVALLGLYLLAPAARTAVQTGLDRIEPPPAPAPPLTPAERVRELAGRRPADPLLTALAELAGPDAGRGASPEARAELAAELARLADPGVEGRAEVRTAALTALAAWHPDGTRTAVRAALRSPDPAERRLALALAGRWADPDTAALVAARLSDRREADDARRALLAMGGPAAEAALLPLLHTDDRRATRLVVLELLEQVGGPEALAALRRMAAAGDSPGLREEARARADGLERRLMK
jgi:hypothetical protein